MNKCIAPSPRRNLSNEVSAGNCNPTPDYDRRSAGRAIRTSLLWQIATFAPSVTLKKIEDECAKKKKLQKNARKNGFPGEENELKIHILEVQPTRVKHVQRFCPIHSAKRSCEIRAYGMCKSAELRSNGSSILQDVSSGRPANHVRLATSGHWPKSRRCCVHINLVD